jgi:hypothetical protein
MKSPQEVAAAKSDFLDELATRVGHFARGADLSKRYARELHVWLGERHRDDERFDRVLGVLRDYPSRVGQADARDACRQLLDTVRGDVEGEWFPWRSVPDDQQVAWDRAFAAPAQGVDVSGACPICGEPTLRRYLRAYESGRGGGWEWCGTCFSFDHYQAVVPDWWDRSLLLDAVPMSVLEHSPEFLERALRLAENDLS